MMAGKVVGLGFEVISKLGSYFLMRVNQTNSTTKQILSSKKQVSNKEII